MTDNRLKVIIVDDESAARETLVSLLEAFFPETELLAEADSADKALALFKVHQPDLVFLDIEMPKLSGIGLLKLLPKRNFEVVFTTAYQEYALKAIKLSALDYLLKPLGVEELGEVIRKAREKKSKTLLQERLEILQHRLGNGESGGGRIALPSMEGFEVIDLQNILRCEGENNYTRFYTSESKSMLIARTLAEYEKILPYPEFVRIHQSHLINLKHVVRYMKGRGGNVEMTDGSIVPVSREKKKDFLRELGAQK